MFFSQRVSGKGAWKIISSCIRQPLEFGVDSFRMTHNIRAAERGLGRNNALLPSKISCQDVFFINATSGKMLFCHLAGV